LRKRLTAHRPLKRLPFRLPNWPAKVPAAKPDDVKSADAIVKAAYDVISGPAGPRNWDALPAPGSVHAGG